MTPVVGRVRVDRIRIASADESRPTSAAKARGESSAVTVQDAVYETIHHSRREDGSAVPVKALAQDAQIPLAILYDCADEHRDRKLRAEEVPALVRASGNPLIIATIARACGGTFVPVPTAPTELSTDLRLASDALRESADIVRAFSDAIAHGRVSDEDAARIAGEADQAVMAILAIKLHALAIVVGRGDGGDRC